MFINSLYKKLMEIVQKKKSQSFSFLACVTAKAQADYAFLTGRLYFELDYARISCCIYLLLIKPETDT